ncbi:MAG: T9SS type A sorting domain-containing protein [Owenweeksia sp.]|nr:T9SS type A sorting domain-containing protein [Owenweeksia sp.]
MGIWATTIEQRDLSGIVKAAYQFPTKPADADNFFQLKILENSNKDWLMFSGVTDGYLISDSLYQVGMSLDRNHYNTFLMRRSGQIFRDLAVTQPIADEAGNPFSLYPNPARFHEVFVRSSSDAKPFTHFQLTSLDGRVVESGAPVGEGFPQYIKFSTRLRGLFLLHLFGNGTPQTFKLYL